MVILENVQPEDFLGILKNFKTVIDRNRAADVIGRINFLHMILHRESLQNFDELASKNNGKENSHLKEIQEGLLKYFTLINTISNKKSAMLRAMKNLAPHVQDIHRMNKGIKHLSTALS